MPTSRALPVSLSVPTSLLVSHWSSKVMLMTMSARVYREVASLSTLPAVLLLKPRKMSLSVTPVSTVQPVVLVSFVVWLLSGLLFGTLVSLLWWRVLETTDASI